MNKKSILVIAIILLIGAVTTISYNYNKGSTSTSVVNVPEEKNPWDLVMSVGPNDSNKFVEVIYQEKYGLEKIVSCKAVFENVKAGEYKCISASLGNLILQKSNLNSFKTKIVTIN